MCARASPGMSESFASIRQAVPSQSVSILTLGNFLRAAIEAGLSGLYTLRLSTQPAFGLPAIVTEAPTHGPETSITFISVALGSLPATTWSTKKSVSSTWTTTLSPAPMRPGSVARAAAGSATARNAVGRGPQSAARAPESLSFIPNSFRCGFYGQRGRAPIQAIFQTTRRQASLLGQIAPRP